MSPVTSSALAALQLPPTVQGPAAASTGSPPTRRPCSRPWRCWAKSCLWSAHPGDRPIRGGIAAAPRPPASREFIYEQPAFPESAYTFKHALTQEVAYNAVLLERRRLLHECAARAIEGLFAERLPEHYHALAHHYRRSGNTTKAIDYLHRAGQQAVERSAYAEAVGHLTTALDLLIALPESHERSQQGVDRADDPRHGVAGDQGRNAPEVEQCYIRARAV